METHLFFLQLLAILLGARLLGEGAGVGELLAEHAEKNVSDHDFRQERQLPNGWTLNSKEDLLYYRLFREHFGETGDFHWMGRTKATTAPTLHGERKGIGHAVAG